MSGSVSMVDGHIDPDTSRMTDKEIIKALECCKMPVGSGSCNDCPFDYQRKKRLTSTDKSCTTLMFDYALDLINRQQAEIERLKNRVFCKVVVDEEKMRSIINEKMLEYELDVEAIKSEAIKEFAERYKTLLETELHWCECADEIIKPLDNLVKEMVGK